MSPLIGMTASLESDKISTRQNYADPVLGAGGFPVILPYTEKEPKIQEIIHGIDGLLLTGGADIDPALYSEEPLPGLQKVDPKRDRFEMLLIQKALELDLPIFAICRGNQMLNIAAGGTVEQDLFQRANIIQHHQNSPRDHQSHHVQITAGSLLHQILNVEQLRVNSFHHQAVKDTAPEFQISATSGDGVPEAIENGARKFILGVQWHPGDLAQKDIFAQKLFQAFVNACL